MRRFLNLQSDVILITTITLILGFAAKAGELQLPSEEYGWVKVESPNFTVFSNAGETIARQTSETIEQLRAVLAYHIDRVPAKASEHTYLYVFDFFTDAFLPYGPMEDGKPVPTGGYYFNRPVSDYSAIVERDHRFPDHMDIYHRYLHSVMDAHLAELPLWLEEGLAEFYSVFQIKEGKAVVGYRINRHIAWLRNYPWMPLAELLAVDRSSPEYNEDERTGIFYAQSWLLTHMLLTEHPEGRAQTAAYAEMLREGVDRDTAFTKAFDTTYRDLEKQLKRYIRNRSHHYSVFPMSPKIIRNTKISEMTRTEVLYRLGDLLAGGLAERGGFAAEHFNAALALDAGYGPAVAGLGLLDESAGREEAALAHYERAASLTPGDYRINLLLGRGLINGIGSNGSRAERSARLQQARTALRRAAELRPDLVEPWAELGSSYLMETENIEGGIEALERAMELQPKRPDVGVYLTTLYVKQDSTEMASSVIARMKAAGVDERAILEAEEVTARLEIE